MKLRYYGHSCFLMTFSDGTSLVTDPFDETVGYPLCECRCDAVLTSHDHFDHNHVSSLKGSPVRVCEPGRARVGGVEIMGVESFHDDCRGAKRGKNVMLRVEGDGLRLVHLGDLGHLLTPGQIAALGPVDVLMIPVGGVYTIDSRQAFQTMQAVSPRMTVAMHFKTPVNGFPMMDASEFLRLTAAASLPREIEITRQTLESLPHAAVLSWQ